MVFPKADFDGGLRFRFDRQTEQRGVCLGLGSFGLTVLGGVAPRPGSPGLAQFPRFAPASEPM